MSLGMEKILGPEEQGGRIEGRITISNLLGDVSGLYGVFFR